MDVVVSHLMVYTERKVNLYRGFKYRSLWTTIYIDPKRPVPLNLPLEDCAELQHLILHEALDDSQAAATEVLLWRLAWNGLRT